MNWFSLFFIFQLLSSLGHADQSFDVNFKKPTFKVKGEFVLDSPLPIPNNPKFSGYYALYLTPKYFCLPPGGSCRSIPMTRESVSTWRIDAELNPGEYEVVVFARLEGSAGNSGRSICDAIFSEDQIDPWNGFIIPCGRFSIATFQVTNQDILNLKIGSRLEWVHMSLAVHDVPFENRWQIYIVDQVTNLPYTLTVAKSKISFLMFPGSFQISLGNELEQVETLPQLLTIPSN